MGQNLIRAIVLVLAMAGTANASEPQDCGNEDYIGQFLDAPNATDFEC